MQSNFCSTCSILLQRARFSLLSYLNLRTTMLLCLLSIISSTAIIFLMPALRTVSNFSNKPLTKTGSTRNSPSKRHSERCPKSTKCWSCRITWNKPIDLSTSRTNPCHLLSKFSTSFKTHKPWSLFVMELQKNSLTRFSLSIAQLTKKKIKKSTPWCMKSLKRLPAMKGIVLYSSKAKWTTSFSQTTL